MFDWFKKIFKGNTKPKKEQKDFKKNRIPSTKFQNEEFDIHKHLLSSLKFEEENKKNVFEVSDVKDQILDSSNPLPEPFLEIDGEGARENEQENNINPESYFEDEEVIYKEPLEKTNTKKRNIYFDFLYKNRTQISINGRSGSLKFPETWKKVKEDDYFVIFKSQTSLLKSYKAYVFKHFIHEDSSFDNNLLNQNIVFGLLKAAKKSRLLSQYFFYSNDYVSPLVPCLPVYFGDDKKYLSYFFSDKNIEPLLAKKRISKDVLKEILFVLKELESVGLYVGNGIDSLLHFIFFEKNFFGKPAVKFFPHKLFSFRRIESSTFTNVSKLLLMYFEDFTHWKGNQMQDLKGVVNRLNDYSDFTELYYKTYFKLFSEKVKTAKVYMDLKNIETSIHPMELKHDKVTFWVHKNEEAIVLGRPYVAVLNISAKSRLDVYKDFDEELKKLKKIYWVDSQKIDSKNANQVDDKMIMERIKKDVEEEQKPIDKIVIFTGDGDFLEIVDWLRKNKKTRNTEIVFVSVPGSLSGKIKERVKQDSRLKVKNLWEYTR